MWKTTWNTYSDMVCLNRLHHFKCFKRYLTHILIGPFLTQCLRWWNYFFINLSSILASTCSMLTEKTPEQLPQQLFWCLYCWLSIVYMFTCWLIIVDRYLSKGYLWCCRLQWVLCYICWSVRSLLLKNSSPLKWNI